MKMVPELVKGQMYHVVYNHEAANGRIVQKEFVGQYLGPSVYGREDFSLRPIAGTSSIDLSQIVAAEEVSASTKPTMPMPMPKV
jgi:hypothetical protein